jgi:hypothetical protein
MQHLRAEEDPKPPILLHATMDSTVVAGVCGSLALLIEVRSPRTHWHTPSWQAKTASRCPASFGNSHDLPVATFSTPLPVPCANPLDDRAEDQTEDFSQVCPCAGVPTCLDFVNHQLAFCPDAKLMRPPTPLPRVHTPPRILSLVCSAEESSKRPSSLPLPPEDLCSAKNEPALFGTFRAFSLCCIAPAR